MLGRVARCVRPSEKFIGTLVDTFSSWRVSAEVSIVSAGTSEAKEVDGRHGIKAGAKGFYCSCCHPWAWRPKPDAFIVCRVSDVT